MNLYAYVNPLGWTALVLLTLTRMSPAADPPGQPVATYRTQADRAHRAIAGLSMGGAQTLNISSAKLDEYAYIGVFSSGIFGIAGGFGGTPPSKIWEEEQHGHTRSCGTQTRSQAGLVRLWERGFLVQTFNTTVSMLKSHHFDVADKENGGGHTWENGREYLQDFAPRLYQEK